MRTNHQMKSHQQLCALINNKQEKNKSERDQL